MYCTHMCFSNHKTYCQYNFIRILFHVQWSFNHMNVKHYFLLEIKRKALTQNLPSSYGNTIIPSNNQPSSLPQTAIMLTAQNDKYLKNKWWMLNKIDAHYNIAEGKPLFLCIYIPIYIYFILFKSIQLKVLLFSVKMC